MKNLLRSKLINKGALYMEKEIDYTKTSWFALATIGISVFSTLSTATFGILTLFLANNINNTINSFNNNQEVVTLQPRDGDVIIQEGGSYRLLQLIKLEDIEFTSVLQETRYDKDYHVENRVDLFNYDNQDWSGRVSFGYTLEKISINADKIMNLHNNIKCIIAYIDFYESIDITTRLVLQDEDAFKIEIFDSDSDDEGDKSIISNTAINSPSRKTYVTNSPEIIPNNGVNFAKLRIEIKYKIESEKESEKEGEIEVLIFSSSILSSNWLTIKED